MSGSESLWSNKEFVEVARCRAPRQLVALRQLVPSRGARTRQGIETVLLTVAGSPSNGGMLAPLKASAMQPPVAVPANGGPTTFATVTRPEGAKVTWTFA